MIKEFVIAFFVSVFCLCLSYSICIYECVDVEYEYEITDKWITNSFFGEIHRLELDNETVISVSDFDYHNYNIGDTYIINDSEIVRR